MKKLSILLAFLIIGGISSTLNAQARVTVSADPDGSLSGQCDGATNIGNNSTIRLYVTNISNNIIGNLRAENPRFRFDIPPHITLLDPHTVYNFMIPQDLCNNPVIYLSPGETIFIPLHINIIAAQQEGCGTFTADLSYDFCTNTGRLVTHSAEISRRVYAYETGYLPTSEGNSFVPANKTTLTVFPNPFSGFTNIQYDLPADMSVKVSLFDIYGRERKVLLDEIQYAGKQNLSVDGIGLEKGTYFCIVETPSFRKVEKLIKN